MLHVSMKITFFAITVERTFVMPYQGLIVYFKLKRFTRLEISTSVINTIITGKNTTPLTGGVEGFLQILLLSRFFVSFWVA